MRKSRKVKTTANGTITLKKSSTTPYLTHFLSDLTGSVEDCTTSSSFDSKSLIAWFKKEKRLFPWRENPTPYSVWISEVMLQQTRASVVVSYYERWMRQFPSIEALAQASIDEVIKAWEGLGYYSRARNLHAGARFVAAHFDGKLPECAEELKKIKGLGPYTIGAIRSFAFKQRAAAVDGNVLRVLARYFLIEEDISKPATVKTIREYAEAILPVQESWVFSEALIELGATHCGRKPMCGECPVRSSCRAYALGEEQNLPFKSKKQQVELLHRTAFVISCKEHYLIKKVAKGEVMSDLHEFPYIQTESEGKSVAQLLRHIKTNWKLAASLEKEFPLIKHAFTRFRVQLKPLHFSVAEKCPVEAFQWVTMKELSKLPFSSGHRRILSLLQGEL